MAEVRIMPDVVGPRNLVTLQPEESVRAAARLMAHKKISAILVVQDHRLKGICTERDITTRVVAAGLPPDATAVDQVMTHNPDTVAPDAFLREAWERMSAGGYRHLPIVDGHNLVGIVSVRDLQAALTAQLEADLLEREAFIFGVGMSGLN